MTTRRRFLSTLVLASLAVGGVAAVWFQGRPTSSSAVDTGASTNAREIVDVVVEATVAGDAPPPHAPPPVASVPVVSRPAREWDALYIETDDLHAFARSAARAAIAGDGRAQYWLGIVLEHCAAMLRADSEHPNERARLRLLRESRRCARFRDEDPLAGLDVPENAGFQYWRAKAVESGDALAVMQRALLAQAAVLASGSMTPEAREQLLADVRVGVESRDPGALLLIGELYLAPGLMVEQEYGYAWWLAACEAGYDCSNENPLVGGGCVEAGTCDAGMTLPLQLQREVGTQRYAEIYAVSQYILYLVNQGDWQGLQRYLEIKP